MDGFDQIRLGLLRQVFPPGRSLDIPATLAEEFQRAGFAGRIKPGQRVLITSGSRGIDSMLEVLQNLVRLVKDLGAWPLILPAMGSHGGGTAEGQVEVLAHLGQTEETLGAPIYRDYQPFQTGEVFDGQPVFADRAADSEHADHVILVGRIKDHTEFSGFIESGLQKMAVVGLGRMAGAVSMHRTAVRHTASATIQAMAAVNFRRLPVLGGLALIEDQRGRLHHLEAVPTADLPAREPELLETAKRLKAKLPWERLDLLLVDEMGKDFSGAGLDTKVIGRILSIYEKEMSSPAITRLITRRLSAKGGGNAIGLGLSDFITRRLYEAVDLEMTRLNSMVAVAPEKGRCPIVAPDTRSALEMALATVGPWRPETLELAWVPNTKELEYIAVSPSLWTAAAGDERLERLRPPELWPWRSEGEGPDFGRYLTDRLGEAPAPGRSGPG